MDLELRAVSPDEAEQYVRAVAGQFGDVPTDEEVALWRRELEVDRALAWFEAGEVVGTAGAVTFELTVPGEVTVPAAGVTEVGVRATHRRQGLLTRMMAEQLDDVARRGEPVAILLASESIIYGRFGYGLATSRTSVSIDVRYGAFRRLPAPGGRLRLVDRDTAGKVLPGVFDAARRRQPGDVNRNQEWWDIRLDDPEFARRGLSGAFRVVHEDDTGRADGYAIYRYKDGWIDGNPAKEVVVVEVVGLHPEVEAALWRYLLDLDLVATVTCGNRPVEDPLRWLLADPRRLRATSLTDFVWVRLVDVPVALAGRRYPVDGRLVLDVVDDFRPQSSGRYELDVSGGHARCTPTEADPDVSLSVETLGSCYLGGIRLSTLAAAGRAVEHRPGALGEADLLFSSAPLPHCRTGF